MAECQVYTLERGRTISNGFLFSKFKSNCIVIIKKCLGSIFLKYKKIYAKNAQKGFVLIMKGQYMFLLKRKKIFIS